jgi:hypothetical protein
LWKIAASTAKEGRSHDNYSQEGLVDLITLHAPHNCRDAKTESSKSKRKQEHGGMTEASRSASPSDLASPEMFGKHVLESLRTKGRWFPVVGDITLSAFLKEIDCRLDDDIILELEEG